MRKFILVICFILYVALISATPTEQNVENDGIIQESEIFCKDVGVDDDYVNTCVFNVVMITYILAYTEMLEMEK